MESQENLGQRRLNQEELTQEELTKQGSEFSSDSELDADLNKESFPLKSEDENNTKDVSGDINQTNSVSSESVEAGAGKERQGKDLDQIDKQHKAALEHLINGDIKSSDDAEVIASSIGLEN